MALISCKNLFAGYNSSLALEDVSFKVEAGDYLCIIGQNGSGKTTLIKCLLGIMAPKKGKIIMGLGLTTKEIGYLPQQTSIQSDFPATVWEVVLSGCLGQRGLSPFYTQKEKSLAREKIEEMGLAKITGKSFRALSGGQQQRVLLARSLCGAKKLLVLDEPAQGLDPNVKGELNKIIKEINLKNQVAIIMVSHDLKGAIENSDKIMHLDTKVLYYGPAGAYRQSEACKSFAGGGGDA